MDFLHKTPADIWRMLIPVSHWMFRESMPEDELIFHYRDHIYFVNEDGSVLALPKPACFEQLDLETLLKWLATSEETIDFDDNGQFDYGFVLKQMGYLMPTRKSREMGSYRIEIINTVLPSAKPTCYVLKKVSFLFALYHGLMRCHNLNRRSGWEYEHEIKSIWKQEQNQHEGKVFG
ncbi:hypothetical protein KDJ56_06665 [Brevibacillus composti]|uniref:Uncharacterized protein n=1 Tax=Brevibacillus composti TaxID=2796470 RepID=A0A7T5EN40_9BACL|nr:hypothetical protein [Brevibacillus composti]QQE75623.1 hypothetical protein JD108_06985 [Brevibacillus composti]QUO42649.1 hypothetical protein KDJ56_06665 [Brevibacillus composti]